MVKHLTGRILDFLLPTPCAFCHSPVGASYTAFLCRSCWSDFSLLTGATCPCCGALFGSPEAVLHSPGHLCSACRSDPPHYEQSLSVGYFEGSLREAIHVLKYRPCRSLGAPLAAWMAEQVSLGPVIDMVMPVPLHRSRLRARGFNQALLLAAGFSRANGLVLSYDNLCRSRSTRPQVELTGRDRIVNVKDAFALRRPSEVDGKQVLIIDDVYTTGATVNECARVLKRSGAAGVTALTAARAV